MPAGYKGNWGCVFVGCGVMHVRLTAESCSRTNKDGPKSWSVDLPCLIHTTVSFFMFILCDCCRRKDKQMLQTEVHNEANNINKQEPKAQVQIKRERMYVLYIIYWDTVLCPSSSPVFNQPKLNWTADWSDQKLQNKTENVLKQKLRMTTFCRKVLSVNEDL